MKYRSILFRLMNADTVRPLWNFSVIALLWLPLQIKSSGIVNAQRIDNPFSEITDADNSLPVYQRGGFFENGFFYHVVKEGDNLLAIAKIYIYFTDEYTVESLIERISAINSLRRYLIYKNQKLIIPVVRTDYNKIPRVIYRRSPGYKAAGIYLSALTAGSLRGQKLIRRFADAGGSTIVFDVKDVTGEIFCPVNIPLARRIGALTNTVIRDVSKLISYIKVHNLHAAARISIFADTMLAGNMSNYTLRDAEKNPVCTDGKVLWTDPSHPEVQEYNLEVIREVCSFGVDEIQLDYIRFPSVYGKIDMYAGPDQRRDKIITAFVKKVYNLTVTRGIHLTLDVFGITIWGQEIDILTTGQRLEELCLYSHAINPMIYPSHFDPGFAGLENPADNPERIIFMSMNRLQEIIRKAGAGTVIRPWLQAFPYKITDFGPEYIIKSVKSAESAGRAGYMLWSAENRYETVFTAYDMMKIEKESVISNE
ncbi:MAG TPA: hypothetical protein DC049_05350 [Spirochaetia bacterium]|nr:hypothetical protein [Spirochaetia bacterium]